MTKTALIHGRRLCLARPGHFFHVYPTYCPRKHRVVTVLAKAPSTEAQQGSAKPRTGLGLQAAWFAAEQFGNMVGVTRKQQQQQQDSQQTFTLNRAEALAEIRADYDQNYFVSGAGAMKAYAPDCLFADPFTGFRGVQRFKKNVSNLGSLILDKKLDIYSWEEGEDSLKTKWRFSAVLDLPWKPLLAAGGSTTHVFDKETGLVVKHLEDWDADPGKVLRRLLRPAAKVPGTRWEAGMQALHDGDALGVWQALSPGVLRVTLVVAPLLLVVHLARGEGLPGLGGALLEDGCYLALVAAGVTELVKVVKHVGGAGEG